jgi:hypothetical protein
MFCPKSEQHLNWLLGATHIRVGYRALISGGYLAYLIGKRNPINFSRAVLSLLVYSPLQTAQTKLLTPSYVEKKQKKGPHEQLLVRAFLIRTAHAIVSGFRHQSSLAMDQLPNASCWRIV